jgi:hypothetical protein
MVGRCELTDLGSDRHHPTSRTHTFGVIYKRRREAGVHSVRFDGVDNGRE